MLDCTVPCDRSKPLSLGSSPRRAGSSTVRRGRQREGVSSSHLSRLCWWSGHNGRVGRRRGACIDACSLRKPIEGTPTPSGGDVDVGYTRRLAYHAKGVQHDQQPGAYRRQGGTRRRPFALDRAVRDARLVAPRARGNVSALWLAVSASVVEKMVGAAVCAAVGATSALLRGVLVARMAPPRPYR